jgi:hypothetical protein
MAAVRAFMEASPRRRVVTAPGLTSFRSVVLRAQPRASNLVGGGIHLARPSRRPSVQRLQPRRHLNSPLLGAGGRAWPPPTVRSVSQTAPTARCSTPFKHKSLFLQHPTETCPRRARPSRDRSRVRLRISNHGLLGRRLDQRLRARPSSSSNLGVRARPSASLH